MTKCSEAGSIKSNSCQVCVGDSCNDQQFRNELAEYKQRAEAAEAKLRELEMQEPEAYLVHYRELTKGGTVRQCTVASLYNEEPIATQHEPDIEYRTFLYSFPLYAKPFPAPKQEEK